MHRSVRDRERDYRDDRERDRDAWPSGRVHPEDPTPHLGYAGYPLAWPVGVGFAPYYPAYPGFGYGYGALDYRHRPEFDQPYDPDFDSDLSRRRRELWREGERQGGVSGALKRFVGKGPKGYKRSDDRILEDVNERLSEGRIDAYDVEVSVHQGEVKLSGTVPDRRSKRIAEDLAESVTGVVDVDNQIRVTHQGMR